MCRIEGGLAHPVRRISFHPILSVLIFLTILCGVLAALLVGREVRHRRLLREQARLREEHAQVSERLMRLSQAIESAADAIGIGDMESNSLYHNRAHEALFGYTVDELNTIDEPAALFADKAVARQIHESIRRDQSWSGETEIKTREGRVIPAFVRADIIRNPQGQAIGIFGVFTDITERRAQERALILERERAAKAERLEALGLLAGGVAHDFNNLLQIVVSGAEVLRVSSDDPEVMLMAQQIEKAANRGRELTRNLFAFAHGDTPAKKKVSPGPIVAEAVQGATAQTAIELTLELAPDLEWVEVDPVQFDQVISNLAVNAVQAMPEGGRLQVRARNVLNWVSAITGRAFVGQAVCITVSDNGAGIPPAVLARIWEPFFTTKKQGTGLGLATTHTVIKKHGGAIEVQSELGRGTTFTVILPACRREALAVAV